MPPIPPFSSPHPDPFSAVQDAVERERLHLAQDLHDDLGGRLIAVKMALAAGDPDAAQRADRLLDQAIDAMHNVLQRLRPPELALGLVAALQQMADDFGSPALSCRFSSNQPEIDAAPEVTLGLLRIGREALANIGQYAQATQVTICLTQSSADGDSDSDDDGSLRLDIVDDGRGYPAQAPDSASIARRLQALGGTAERRVAPGGSGEKDGGCHLHIRIPIARPPRPEAAKIVR
jgi:two-component system sensor histidine kinase UhpB